MLTKLSGKASHSIEPELSRIISTLGAAVTFRISGLLEMGTCACAGEHASQTPTRLAHAARRPAVAKERTAFMIGTPGSFYGR
ncbi:hypothetical protein [Methyloversatilis sp.]|uniref:hypothetical protein n=1 Tax=Methyloversatilis sp. TaxID=2569862 RepID=UPI0027BB0917|nr:hypothetical protein [Methyloversatilis sp.]